SRRARSSPWVLSNRNTSPPTSAATSLYPGFESTQIVSVTFTVDGGNGCRQTGSACGAVAGGASRVSVGAAAGASNSTSPFVRECSTAPSASRNAAPGYDGPSFATHVDQTYSM